MHQYKGRSIIHFGPMFSGKTTGLQEFVRRFKIANFKVVVFKPKLDDRYSEESVVSHNAMSEDAIGVETTKAILAYYKENLPDVVAIDEIQFFNEQGLSMKDLMTILVTDGCTVVMAGLDLDYKGDAFELTQSVIPYVDYVYKHHPVCKMCGSDAWISHRISDDTSRFSVNNEYVPLCRKCYNSLERE